MVVSGKSMDFSIYFQVQDSFDEKVKKCYEDWKDLFALPPNYLRIWQHGVAAPPYNVS
jgi:hypothetical protein